MAKRSREDFEPSSPVPKDIVERRASAWSGSQTSRNQAASTKVLHLEAGSGEARAGPMIVMRCSLPPHRQVICFSSYEEYEVHYNKTHVNRCLECRKNFPTEHFLSLHIEENHDAIVGVRKERGEKTYCCFVEDCEKKCSTPQKRRMHLIDKHLFPKDYDFYMVNDGIDRRSSMLGTGKHRRRSSAAQHTAGIGDRARRRNLGVTSGIDNQTEGDAMRAEDSDEGILIANTEEDVDTDIADLTGAMSALKFVPSSVRFGRGRGRARGGFSNT